MKKQFVFLFASIFCISMFSYCGTAGDEASEDECTQETKKEEAVEQEEKLELVVGNEQIDFDNVLLDFDDMFGPQMTVSGFYDADEEQVENMTFTESFFSINIENLEIGKADRITISLRGYQVKNAKAEVLDLEIGSGTWGPVIDRVHIDFSASATDSEGNTHDLTGSYRK